MNAPLPSHITGFSLRSHQRDAVSAAVGAFAEADRTQVIKACGTGKTRVGPAVAIEMAARTVVIYVPSLALIEQTLPEWLLAYGSQLEYLCVCSDQTVTRLAQQDCAEFTLGDLITGLGIPPSRTTTDRNAVNAFLSVNSTATRVVFCTYHSGDALADGLPDGFQFDLAIFDEAHRTAGRNGMFSGPLRDDHTPIAKRMFMTATPKHVDYRSQEQGDGPQAAVYSMDDEATYGTVCYRLSLREAIRRGLIADYRIIVSVVDDQMVKADTIQGGATLHGHQVDAETVAHAIALRRAMDRFGSTKAITFHASVADAEAFANHPVTTAQSVAKLMHINGAMPTASRRDTLKAFAEASEPVAVTNAKCLTEGVDVPTVDLVAFLTPKRSQVDIIQAIGRALRKPAGSQKDKGYVLVPLYVPEINCETLSAASLRRGYDVIWDLVQILREHDEVVESAITDEALRNKEDEDADLLNFIEIIGPELHLEELRSAITAACVEICAQPWDRNYAILKRYHAKHGQIKIAGQEVIEGSMIGNFVMRQRSLRRKGLLSNERCRLLNELGMVWDPLAVRWDQMCRCYERLHALGLPVNLPNNATFEGESIGLWGRHQRNAYANGSLNTEQIARLERIGFSWSILDARWMEHFAVHQGQHARGENVNVTKTAVVDGLKIGEWDRAQRARYRDGKLSRERIQLLESVGFEFNPRKATWMTYFDIMRKRHEQGLSVNVAVAEIIDGYPLGQWQATQRAHHKKGILEIWQIVLLRSVRFSVDVFEARIYDKVDEVNRCLCEGRRPNQLLVENLIRQARHHKNVPQEILDTLGKLGRSIAVKKGPVLPRHSAAC